MMNGRALATSLVVSLLAAGTVLGAEEENKPAEEKIKLDGIKCLFCEMQVKEDVFVEYKQAKVYLGCEGCVGAFKKNVKKVATKANAQLVATKQAKQKACPFSGMACNDEFTLAVGKAKVAFCCADCQKAAAKLEGDARLKRLFNEDAFKKAFEVATREEKQEQD